MSFTHENIRVTGFWYPHNIKAPDGTREYTSGLVVSILNNSSKPIKALTLETARFPWKYGSKFLSVLPLQETQQPDILLFKKEYGNIQEHTVQTRVINLADENEHLYYWFIPYAIKGTLASGESFSLTKYQDTLQKIASSAPTDPMSNTRPLLSGYNLHQPNLIHACPI